MSSSDPGIRPNHIDPRRPPEQELRIGIESNITLALAGDCIASRPVAGLRDRLPAFNAVVNLLRNADLACGNLETSIIDMTRFSGHPYSWVDDWTLHSTPDVASDLAALGFGMFGRANNHALDWGIEGMRETADRLDAAGLAHAGAGENLGFARMPAYRETPKGRIGLVSAASTFRPTTEALSAHDATPGRPGISALRLQQVDILPQAEIDRLAGLVQACIEDGHLTVFGRRFEAGSKAGYRHEMNPADLAEILKSVRLGKQHSDLLVVMLHAHETGRDGYPEPPSPFVRDFARSAIEAGADIVSVSGIHHLGPVDLYRGRPIFYGLGNFIWSDMQDFLPADLVDLNRDLMARACENPGRATAADFSAISNAGYFNHPQVFETVLPVIRFAERKLVEVVLHPIELGYGDPLTTSGIPRMATGEQADRILQRVQTVSADYGCDHAIAVASGKGYLRP